ncbi:MAG: hypothetical protein K0R59_1223 [Sphingobacterium sp.]|jgi:hypothetical protein|nr:hypothetical protein [Sphingobacterium sp.]
MKKYKFIEAQIGFAIKRTSSIFNSTQYSPAELNQHSFWHR